MRHVLVKKSPFDTPQHYGNKKINLDEVIVICSRAPDKVCIGKLFSLFLIQNICCGYSKEPSQSDGSFEHPKHMSKLMGKKIITILHS